MDAASDAAFALPPGPARLAALLAAQAALVAERSRDGLQRLAAALLDEARCATAAAVAALSALPPLLAALPPADNAFCEAVSVGVLELLRGRSAFDIVDVGLRDVLYDVKWGEAQFAAAGAALAAAKIDSAAGPGYDQGTRGYLWLRVVQAYLKAEDDVTADRYIKRATELHRHMAREVQMTYAVAMAQLLDYRRKFLEAAIKFEDGSRRGQALGFPEADLLHFLGQAVRCILLAPVGPARVRIMGSLARDERIASIQVRGLARGLARETSAARAGTLALSRFSLPLPSLPPVAPRSPLPPAAARAAVHAGAHEHGAHHLCGRRRGL